MTVARLVAKLDHVPRKSHDAPAWIPHYLSDWNLLLPFLGDDYDIRVRNETACKVTIYRPSDQWDGYGTNINEAAMIALLRAAGVEVVT